MEQDAGTRLLEQTLFEVEKVIAGPVGGTFHRIQFMPDLVPSDIPGTRSYRAATFDVELGPVMANLVLADEINDRCRRRSSTARPAP